MAAGAKSAIVLLAAGESRRLGQPKQLIIFEGKTLLRRAAEAACSVCENVFVVVGSRADLLLPELENLPVQILKNENWQSGMASSIRLGVATAMAEVVDLQAVAISVCDQPRLSAAVFEQLFLEKNRSGRGIVASQYADAVGVPVVFGRQFFTELLDLSGEQGARRILAAHPAEVVSVEFLGGEWDVDFPADLPV